LRKYNTYPFYEIYSKWISVIVNWSTLN
jgi:hypothetical protein